MDSFSRLVEIMARLRAPDGCPWDIQQTHHTLRAYLIEESAEVLDAIEGGDDAHLCEELGDLLLQPVFHAQIAAETGRFTLDDVLNGICEKLIRRHPHVFGDVFAPDADAVLRNWDAIKKQEKAALNEVSASILSGIPAELPALAQSLKISKKAAKVGFEWPDEASVVEKLREEVAEIEDALKKESNERVAEEIGDLMFTAVNVARWRGIHPELALRDVNRKFMTRFAYMEDLARERGLELEELSPAQWEEFWNEAKQLHFPSP